MQKRYYFIIFIIFSTLLFSCKKDEDKYVPAGEPCAGIPDVFYVNHKYTTVQIGSQCWLRENINVGKMLLNNNLPKNNDTIEKFCYNNDDNLCNELGALYTWEEAMAYDTTNESIRGICPEGWHIPSDIEFFVLEQYVDDSINEIAYGERGYDAGLKLRRAGSTGFEVLMSGVRDEDAIYYGKGSGSSFWSSTKSFEVHALGRFISKTSNTIGRYHYSRKMAFSVRCVMN